MDGSAFHLCLCIDEQSVCSNDFLFTYTYICTERMSRCAGRTFKPSEAQM